MNFRCAEHSNLTPVLELVKHTFVCTFSGWERSLLSLASNVQAAERDSQGGAAAAKAAVAAQAAAEQQLKQCHAAQTALEKYATAAEREAERLEAAAKGAAAAQSTAQQQLQECRAAQAPLQRKALEQERLLDAISGRGENCLNSLQAAQVSSLGTDAPAGCNGAYELVCETG